MPEWKKKKNILHIVEWVLAVISGALIADLICFRCMGNDYMVNQFICATVYGYVIVSSLVFLGLCFSEDVPEKTLYALTALGSLLHLASGIMVFLTYYDNDYHHSNDVSTRLILAVITILANFVIYGVEFILLLAKKSALE